MPFAAVVHEPHDEKATNELACLELSKVMWLMPLFTSPSTLSVSVCLDVITSVVDQCKVNRFLYESGSFQVFFFSPGYVITGMLIKDIHISEFINKLIARIYILL